MNTVVVRCTGCQQLSRVMAEAVGLEVVCPRCEATFLAQVEASAEDPPIVRPAASRKVPVVQPRNTPQPRPIVWDEPEPKIPEVERTAPTGGLTALALLPFGIPLLWLLASIATQREVVWSFAVPVSVAAGACGLAFGIAHVNRWSVTARVKAVVALLLLAYLTAGFLFIVKKEWLQDLRQVLNRGHLNWATFRADPAEEPAIPGQPKEPKLPGFSFKFPLGMSELEVSSPFPNWKSKAYGFHDAKQPGTEVYVVAVARVLGVKPWDADRIWFAGIDKAIVEAAPDAELNSERAVTLSLPLVGQLPETIRGKEYHFIRPGDVWNRIVRVYRLDGHAIYLAVEGPHLTPAATDVQYFLESLRR